METIFTYFLGVNGILLFLMYIDKQRAKKGQFRIPERTFWLLAILGGGTGAVIGMKLFRHKTKHITFQIGMPLLMVTQWILLLFLS